MGDTDWLFLIDFQPVFADPASPWFAPGTREIYPRLMPLVERFGDRVLFSRFVPPDGAPQGSWTPYYRDWPFALAADPAIWGLDSPWRGRREVSATTFHKWTSEAREVLQGAGEIWVGGVSTDCCVLNTVMAAMDDGAKIRLLADACAAGTPEIHQMAVDLMALRAPQIGVSTIAEALAEI
jgi:nicotinamidase-related amidase